MMFNYKRISISPDKNGYLNAEDIFLNSSLFFTSSCKSLGLSRYKAMKIFIEKENKLLELDKSCTGLTLLTELGINPSTVLLVKNNEIVLESELLNKSDDIKILSVVSGG